jgi:hypothetical protein
MASRMRFSDAGEALMVSLRELDASHPILVAAESGIMAIERVWTDLVEFQPSGYRLLIGQEDGGGWWATSSGYRDAEKRELQIISTSREARFYPSPLLALAALRPLLAAPDQAAIARRLAAFDPPVRTMPDGTPCWCPSPQTPEGPGWVWSHVSRCQERRDWGAAG